LGQIRKFVNDTHTRVFVKGARYPALPLSRSLGDILAHHIGVKSEPSVKIVNIKPEDNALTISTQGIYNYLSS
jgi:hypothetical protein